MGKKRRKIKLKTAEESLMALYTAGGMMLSVLGVAMGFIPTVFDWSPALVIPIFGYVGYMNFAIFSALSDANDTKQHSKEKRKKFRKKVDKLLKRWMVLVGLGVAAFFLGNWGTGVLTAVEGYLLHRAHVAYRKAQKAKKQNSLQNQGVQNVTSPQDFSPPPPQNLS